MKKDYFSKMSKRFGKKKKKDEDVIKEEAYYDNGQKFQDGGKKEKWRGGRILAEDRLNKFEKKKEMDERYKGSDEWNRIKDSEGSTQRMVDRANAAAEKMRKEKEEKDKKKKGFGFFN